VSREKLSLLSKDIHNFDGLDLQDDFDEMAALLASLDFVITPPNTMLDFAGAVGVKVLCPYATSENDYRFQSTPDSSDIWFENIIGFKTASIADKRSALLDIADYITLRKSET